MKDLRCRSLESQIGMVSVKARIIGEAVAVAAEVELIVGEVVAAIARHQLRFAIALET